MTRVVVVGAGIAGLSCAFDLVTADPSLDVVLLEADGRTGGKIHTTPFAGVAVDEAADAFLARVPWARELCAELDLDAELTSPASSRAYLYSYGALRRIPADNVLGVPLDLDALAASGIVSDGAVARAREDLGRTTDAVTDRLTRNGEDESIGALIRRRLGDEINDRVVDPLIGGIYAGSTDQLSLESTAPIFAGAAALDGSLIRALRRTRVAPTGANTTPVFYTHPRGVGYITDELHRRLGARVQLANAARKIARNGSGYLVHTDVSVVRADAIVIATPTYAAAKLLATIAPTAADLCARIDYSSVVLIALAVAKQTIDHPLDGSGFLVPKCENRFITACSWSSSKWAHLASDRHAILRVSTGHIDNQRSLTLGDDEIVSSALQDLLEMMGSFDAPEEIRISRWPRSFPQYRPGHRTRVSAIFDALAADAPRVVVAGAAYGGIGIPATIHHARESAERVRLALSS
ncbi:MAG: protoporphyrinogen oxidase [Acidimicrobiales bacterium]